MANSARAAILFKGSYLPASANLSRRDIDRELFVFYETCPKASKYDARDSSP